MKKIISILLALVLIFSVTAVPVAADTETDTLPILTNLGIPMQTYISDSQTAERLFARSVWDIEEYGGRIYIGGGNYAINMNEAINGGVPLLSYTAQNGWTKEASFYEHQMSRFIKADGKLYIPANNRAGYIYSYDGKTAWQEVNGFSAAVHTFDVLVKDGIIYAGYGFQQNGPGRVFASSDGGTTYNPIYMKYNGSNVTPSGSEFARVYNIFEFGGNIYATLKIVNATSTTYDGFYKLDKANNVFTYFGSGHSGLVTNDITGAFDATIGNTFAFCSSNTSNKLMYTTDLTTFNTATLPNNGNVTCVKAINNEFYVSAYTKSGSVYTSNLYKTTDLTNFELVYSLDFSTFIKSFCYYDGAFYFGTSGNRSAPESTIGTVFSLRVDDSEDPEINEDPEIKDDIIVGEPETEGEDDSVLNLPELGLFGKAVKYYDGTTLIKTASAAGDTYTIDYNAPAKEGYYFTCWYTNAAVTQLASGSINLQGLGDGEAVNLYAKYVPYSSVFTIDLTKYNLYNNFVNYGYFIDGVYTTGIVNKGWATKQYTNSGVTVYSAGTDGTRVAANNGDTYITGVNTTPGSWGQRAPLIITNADGSAFVPKANTKYNITINYSYPAHGKDTDKSYIDVFSGVKYDYATTSDAKGTDLVNLAETKVESAVTLSAAVSGTKSTMVTITTGDFTDAVPALGLYLRSGGAKISSTETSFTDASGNPKTGYKVEAFSKIVISSITITEAEATNQLKVTQIVRDEADILAGTAQIFLPQDGSQAYSVNGNFTGYSMAVFSYDADKQSYVLTANYAANASKKGITIPAGGFAYIINKASNGYWANLQASYELITGTGNQDSANAQIVGSNAYVYEADFNIPYISANDKIVTSAEFMTNAFISIGTSVEGKTAFDPTNDSAKLFSGGASVLTPDAFAQDNKEQALRVYFKYKVNDDGTITHKGQNVTLVERGILIKSASQNVELTIENMNHNAITVAKTRDFTRCWDYDGTNGMLTYSNYITEIVGVARQKDIAFRPYLKLNIGGQVEYVLGDQVVYNTEKIESESSEWKQLYSIIGDRQLVWSNEFTTDTTVDSTGFDYSTIVTDNALGNYTNDGSNIRFENGTMSIVTKPTAANDNRVFSSSVLSTYGKLEYKYGYLEMRAKVPFYKGIWPSFWMQSEGKAKEYFDHFSEIDIFEVFGSTTTLSPTIHKWGPWRPASEGGRPHSAKYFKAYSFADNATALDWHTYGFEWNENEMKFYIDGVCYASTSIKEEDDFDTTVVPGMGGFHDYHFVILSSGLYTSENDTGFYFTKDNFNDEMNYTLDYIRLYQNPADGEDFKTQEDF